MGLASLQEEEETPEFSLSHGHVLRKGHMNWQQGGRPQTRKSTLARNLTYQLLAVLDFPVSTTVRNQISFVLTTQSTAFFFFFNNNPN